MYVSTYTVLAGKHCAGSAAPNVNKSTGVCVWRLGLDAPVMIEVVLVTVTCHLRQL